MSDQDAFDLALLIFRCVIGGVMLAHGVNHVVGKGSLTGKIAGTAGWFKSMGMRQSVMQAWMASVTEVGAGTMLVLGLLTPLASAGVIGVMTVAWIIAHRGNGFFIFNPGQGWEYVMVLVASGIVLGVIGPGAWSLDDALDLSDDLTGTTGLMISAGAGIAGGLALLAAFWRPVKKSD
jgi:putative oxidoreductase